MRKRFLGILAGIMMLVGAAVPGAAFAASKCGGTKFFGLDPWYAQLDCDGKEIAQSNFQSDRMADTVLRVVGTVVKDILFLAGMVAVVLVMVGGVKYMLSAGDPGAVAKARNTVSGALVGLVIAILAYAIVTAVLKIVEG